MWTTHSYCAIMMWLTDYSCLVVKYMWQRTKIDSLWPKKCNSMSACIFSSMGLHAYKCWVSLAHWTKRPFIKCRDLTSKPSPEFLVTMFPFSYIIPFQEYHSCYFFVLWYILLWYNTWGPTSLNLFVRRSPSRRVSDVWAIR